MAATAPDWSYVTDEATRDWLHSLPIDEQNELHGRTPDRLQHDFGDRMAAEVYANSQNPPHPPGFENWPLEDCIAWWNARGAEITARREQIERERSAGGQG